ncbi:hypothetical protein LTR56_011696 [Elasticomyces elasticus]|nr:hypothetical protein LTR56_011696 [Elasticomyces elasticus]KAK3658517.1 hypothetical protein LTR22_008870 [Elasticomyces elasticus]KAK4921165.1 hypothetical protein LTR49_011352 [Elasticomyces elasticus]KAK5761882.1 hypothetical protein LTS12_007945 [Elasticomyces elasticus]
MANQDATTDETLTSAVTKVFAIPELLELILLHTIDRQQYLTSYPTPHKNVHWASFERLPQLRALLVNQRVARTFAAMITSSRKLREALFFTHERCDSNGKYKSHPTANDLVTESMVYYNAQPGTSWTEIEWTDIGILGLTRWVHDKGFLLADDLAAFAERSRVGSWRKMLFVSQPMEIPVITFASDFDERTGTEELWDSGATDLLYCLVPHDRDSHAVHATKGLAKSFIDVGASETTAFTLRHAGPVQPPPSLTEPKAMLKRLTSRPSLLGTSTLSTTSAYLVDKTPTFTYPSNKVAESIAYRTTRKCQGRLQLKMDNATDTNPTSAATKVFATFELLEHILMSTFQWTAWRPTTPRADGERDVGRRSARGRGGGPVVHQGSYARMPKNRRAALRALLVNQRVNRDFAAVIRDSADLREALFFSHEKPDRQGRFAYAPFANTLLDFLDCYSPTCHMHTAFEWGATSNEFPSLLRFCRNGEMVRDYEASEMEVFRVQAETRTWRKMLLLSQPLKVAMTTTNVGGEEVEEVLEAGVTAETLFETAFDVPIWPDWR